MKQMASPNLKFRKTAGLVLLGLLLLAAAAQFFPVAEWTVRVNEWLKNQGPLGFLIFVGAYVIGTILFFPASIMTIASGATFGLGWGILLSATGAILGAAAAFLIARHGARRLVEQMAQTHPRFHLIDRIVGEEAWKIIVLLRLSPVVPFNVSNYFYGLTSVKFWHYVWATLIGMFPGTILYVYLGYAGRKTITGSEGQSKLEFYFLILGIVLTIFATVYLARRARRAIRESGP